LNLDFNEGLAWTACCKAAKISSAEGSIVEFIISIVWLLQLG
jgi:hypothetical protein